MSASVTPRSMAPQKNLTAMCASLCLLGGIGCAADSATGSAATDGSASGDDFTGDSATGAATNVQPVYPTAHPRIYLTPNRSRLVASLNAKAAAATRFKANVDAWIGGADI